MKKNILFLESRFDSFFGAQKSMLKLIKSLDHKDFNYNVVTTGEGQLKKGLEANGVSVDIVKLGNKANVFGGKVLRYSFIDKLIVFFQIILYNLKLVYYIFRNKIDIVYVNDSRALLYAVLATKLLRKKLVWYIRADVSDTIFTKIGLRSSNYIITIANGVLRNLPISKIKKFEHKITNIYTGFDFEHYKIIDKNEAKEKLDISTEKLVIGYLGSINQRKGLDLLIDAFIELSETHEWIELLIVGNVSTGHIDYWNALVDKLESSSVSYKYLPYSDNISELYSAMDMFVLPSRSEGLPRVLIEAMGHKVPVIATDVGGTKEIIENESLGIIFDKDNKHFLIKTIKGLLSNREYLHILSENGYRFVSKKFSENKFVDNINSFFKNF